MAGLLYGSGLRLMECVRLRVKDLDFGCAQITVRDAKGGRDRITMLPLNLAGTLRRHLVSVKARHEQDLEDRFGDGASAVCAREKVPERGARMVVAVRVSLLSHII
jgi:integrase